MRRSHAACHVSHRLPLRYLSHAYAILKSSTVLWNDSKQSDLRDIMHSPAVKSYQVSSHAAAVTDSPTRTDSAHDYEVPRGRLKRRRTSSRTPPRPTSPSRGHTRHSGVGYEYDRHRHRRASSSFADATTVLHKRRRRSDAEPDHTLRGRVRQRSGSPSRSLIFQVEEKIPRAVRKRSQPPSRRRLGQGSQSKRREDLVRRLRNHPNLYRQDPEQAEGDRETSRDLPEDNGF